ncbi:hypothetical protein [Streptomyces sp. NPDC102283]|uniref:hypothetical protein n=1 Tax=Streptomyces sp. NPDC102283 TaxID=3366155 RepID=UPI003811D33B
MAGLVLFLECVPRNVHDWVGVRMRAGEEAVERACVVVGGEVEAGMAFMDVCGLVFFDVRFGSIFTDGDRLLFTG